MVDKRLVDLSYHIYWNIDVNIVAGLIGVLSSLAFILICWFKGKRTLPLYVFLVMQILSFTQYTNNLIVLFWGGWERNWFYTAIDYLFYCFISPTCLLFMLVFAEYKIESIKRKIFLLLIPPSFFYLLLLTDPLHHLFFKIADFPRRVYGPLFWLNYVCVILYLMAGVYHLLKYSRKNSNYIKKQAIILIVATLTGILATVVYIFRIWKFAWLIACFGSEITMILFVVATYYRFFKITPLALRRIAENMKESIVVVDNYNEINHYNPHFASNFLSWVPLRKSNDITNFVRELETVVISTDDTARIFNAIVSPTKEPVTGELTITQPTRRTYTVLIQPVFSKQDLIGKVVSFNDISDYKRLLEDYDNKNIELMSLNQELTAMNDGLMTASERLHEYAATVEELSIANERNRLARDVHDILGHTMTLVLTSLEVSQLSCEKDLEITKKYLAEAAQITRNCITELRNSIRGMVPEKITAHNLINTLKKLIADFRISGMTVDFSFTEPEMLFEPVLSNVVYRICQEALTNSFRHGQAKEVSIILRFDNERIKLYIFDNGCGCKEVQPGYGLSGMKQRVTDLGGKITFGSDGERGFTIHAEIPIR